MPICRETRALNADTPKNRHHENPPRFISRRFAVCPEFCVHLCWPEPPEKQAKLNFLFSISNHVVVPVLVQLGDLR